MPETVFEMITFGLQDIVVFIPVIPGGGAKVIGKRERRVQKTKVRENRHNVGVPKRDKKRE
jgi:hypothetical protein